ncbi:hypothetical protein ACQ86N_07550 [Puia sp. P3]|uniref:hypothetical protein n=1 Tax=Puia sp. P3 TaxID=3423952 RepID=UPI003D67785C
MFSVKGCILSFLSGAFFFFLVLSSVWWIPTGIAFWLVYFFMESRRSGSTPSKKVVLLPSATIRRRMGLQTTHIIYKDEQIRHSYLCSYLPLTATADPLSRSLLKFKRGRQPDLANWIRAALEGFSHNPLSPDTIILRALRHDETEIPQSPKTQSPETAQTQQPAEPQTQQSSQSPTTPSLFPISITSPTPLDLLGQKLATSFNCQYLPSHLQKSKPTLSNKTLSREQRETQLQNIYSISRSLPTHHPILVIDDIFTTGATTRAIIHALRQSSPNTPIELFTLAKATYPNR